MDNMINPSEDEIKKVCSKLNYSRRFYKIFFR